MVGQGFELSLSGSRFRALSHYTPLEGPHMFLFAALPCQSLLSKIRFCSHVCPPARALETSESAAFALCIL